jgi:hypothetical protein
MDKQVCKSRHNELFVVCHVTTKKKRLVCHQSLFKFVTKRLLESTNFSNDRTCPFALDIIACRLRSIVQAI